MMTMMMTMTMMTTTVLVLVLLVLVLLVVMVVAVAVVNFGIHHCYCCYRRQVFFIVFLLFGTCQVRVFRLGSQLRVPDLSGHCWTSAASSTGTAGRTFNCGCQIAVGAAGPARWVCFKTIAYHAMHCFFCEMVFFLIIGRTYCRIYALKCHGRDHSK